MHDKSVLVDFEELKMLCSSLLGSAGLGDVIFWVTGGQERQIIALWVKTSVR